MPPPRKPPREFWALGGHLRKARRARGLSQVRCARELGASATTVLNWERSHTQVGARFLPKVLAFLGYDPREETGVACPTPGGS
jgi:transcriptional regulator with XRE-family HTH domain